MFFEKNNILYNGDWHIWHKNILKYEYNKRKKFIDGELTFNPKDEFNTFLELASNEDINNMLIIVNKTLIEEMKQSVIKILKEKNIHTYYNIGDFIFNINKDKIDLLISNNILYLIYDFYDFLRNNGIKTVFIRGNHDRINSKMLCIYEELFDEVREFDYIQNGSENIFITHYPLGFSKDVSLNKQKVSNDFISIDEKLLKIIKYKENNINIHGHTHHKNDYFKLNNIDYFNVCIDNL